jgi:ParB/RepB/Spo0J family partition protein
MLETVDVVARETEWQNGPVRHDFREVPVYALQESPTNPRRSFDEVKLQELVQSIRSQGILVPLIVRDLYLDRFEVVAGARRFRAARLAELATVPVRVVQLTDTQALEYQLIENAIREDVPYEEAMAYKTLLETSEPRYEVASIAAKTGRSITPAPPLGRTDSRGCRGLSGEPNHGRTRRFDRAVAAGAAKGRSRGCVPSGLANQRKARHSSS